MYRAQLQGTVVRDAEKPIHFGEPKTIYLCTSFNAIHSQRADDSGDWRGQRLRWNLVFGSMRI